jgi:PAS domain S-box-containing protein
MIAAVSLLPLTAASLSIALIVLVAVGQRWTAGTRFFLLLNVSTFLWSFGYAIDLALYPGHEATLAVFGSQAWRLLVVMTLGSAFAPTYWFLFAAAMAEKTFWQRPLGVALAHVPAVFSAVAILTNGLTHVFTFSRGGKVVYGPVGPPYQIMTFTLVIAGAVLLMQAVDRRFGRRNAYMLGGATLALLAGAGLWATRAMTGLPIPLNPTPALFPVLDAVLAYQVLRSGLADIVPIATLRGIMDNTDACLAYLDRDFAVVAANGAFVKNSGHTEDELVGRNYFAVIPAGIRRPLFEEVRDNGTAASFRADPEVMPARRTGQTWYWDWSLSPVTGGGKEIEGLVLSLTDVTEAVRQRELSGALNLIQACVHSALEAEETLPEVAAMAASAIAADRASLLLEQRGTWRIMQHCGSTEADWEPFRAEDFPLPALVLQEGRQVAVPDAFNDPRLDPYVMELLAVSGGIATPLLSGGDVVGVLSLEYGKTPAVFGSPEMAFAEDVAAALLSAVQNARLYAAEHRIAETLQRSMMKLPDAIGSLDFAHIYHSATETAMVGGDFYDVFECAPGVVALLIGDVAGKGIEAAVVTSLVKNTIRAEAYESHAPGDVITRSNEILRRQLDVGVFATVFFGVLDVASGELAYCSAGHPPSLVRRGDGDIVRLEDGAPILGALEGIQFVESSVRLGLGDTLLMFTDGVIEARRDSALYGDERLADIVRCAEPEPRHLVHAVYDNVLDFARNSLSDDIALMAVRLAEEPGQGLPS